MEYDVDYFIKKFQRIPEHKWTTHSCHALALNNGNVFEQSCAIGHCGGDDRDVYKTKESCALVNLLDSIASINDGTSKFRFNEKTPKTRVLAALYDIRDKQIGKANIKAVNELINQPCKSQEV